MAVKYLSGKRVTALSTDLVAETNDDTAYTGTGTNNIDYIEYMLISDSSNAGKSISAIRVKIASSANSPEIKGAIYADNGSGTPSTLLATTPSDHSVTATGWQTIPITATVPSDGKVWVAFLAKTSSGYPSIYADTSGAVSDSFYCNTSACKTWATAFANPASTVDNGYRYSVGIVLESPKLGESDATPTYTPDMTSDTNWLDTVSDRIDNNTSTGKIDFDVHRTDTNQALSYDLGTALSNTAWTLRYKMTVDTITQVSDANRMFMGMRSISASSNASTNSDFIGWHSKVGRTGGGVDFKEFHYMTTDGSSMDIEGTTSSVVPTTTTYYITITRKTATTWSLRISTSADYTGGTLHDDISCASGTQGLQYLWIGNVGVEGGSSARFMGTIEDVKIYNGVTTTTSDNAVTVPNGSVAEETDTGKHRIWNSTTSAWVEVG